ncbi:MAG: GNAT family N-acetyltransferase [Cyclobacteriaceae bacterium]
MSSIEVVIASDKHLSYAQEICTVIEESAKQRGTGIAKRSPEYIIEKMSERKAIIALSKEGRLAGFCYIESWGGKQYVANSGLIVHPDFRSAGIAKLIKKKAFEHSRKMFPDAKLFGLTTSLPVMKINSELGYYPVTYNQLTTDEQFWKGCQSCVNYEILMSKNKTNCICTGMLYDPSRKKQGKWDFIKKSKIYERFMRLKKNRMVQMIVQVLSGPAVID